MINKDNKSACLGADSAEVLFAYVDGTLDEVQSDAIERHAAGCAACRNLIDGQRGVWETLDAWEAPELSPEFNRKMHAAVAAESAGGWRGWLASKWAWPTLLVPVSALALIVGTVVVTQMPREQELAPVVEVEHGAVDQKAGIENDVKQIEKTLDDLDVLYTLDPALSSQEKL